MAAKDNTGTFRDPQYAALATGVEQKLGLPTGLVRSIIVDGERTNPDQVSEAGARGLGQFIPTTRKGMIDKHGIDPWLSDANSIESIGLLLKENLARAKGDVEEAVRAYHAGWDKTARGPVNDAYAGRVLRGVERTQVADLGAGFRQWMAQNPAVPAAVAPAPTATGQQAPAVTGNTPFDRLSAGFSGWLNEQRPVEARASEIPGYDGAVPAATMPSGPAAPADPSLVDRVKGIGEAGLALATGATAGVAGGALGGAAALLSGQPGQVFPGMQQGAQALTYAPRTALGQEYTADAAALANEAVPLAGIAPQMQMAAAAARQAAVPATVAARAAVPAARQAAIDISKVVMHEAPAERKPTPGTGGSMGAAGVDAATVRRMAAQELEVPIELTKGQAERSFEAQQFERETAKDAERGGAIRDRYAEQNDALLKNFDASLDKTGALAPDLRRAGVAVDEALTAKAKRDHAEVNVKYTRARKSEEASAPVDQARPVKTGEGDDALTSTPLAFINEQPAGLPSTAVSDAARQYAVKRGIATLDDGVLAPNPKATIQQFEDWRKDINGATGYEPADIRQATILKKLIDGQTEPIAGPLYRDARRARELYARQYEDRAVVADLLRTKRGSNDRQVALEDVFSHSILNRSLDDVRHIRRVLQTGGEQGSQAWRELQGQTIAYLRDEATKNVARDIRGNQIVSPSGLDRALRKLEADGKLDFIFGKKGAEQLRTLNDVAKHVHTAPPGSVNHSNTASILTAAFDLMLTAGTGLPLPIASAVKLTAGHVKDAKVRRRIHESLGMKPTPAPAPQPRTVH